MAKLACFTTLSLDGYFARPDGDVHWFHRADAEFDAFVAGNAQSDGALVFGRRTYEMMKAYWPTPAARAALPAVADGMNRREKYVVYRALTQADWSNTRVLRGEAASVAAELKRESAKPLVILGSASLVTALSEARLIDEYQIVLTPMALGAGRSLFAGMTGNLELSLVETRSFQNGNVFLRYALR